MNAFQFALLLHLAGLLVGIGCLSFITSLESLKGVLLSTAAALLIPINLIAVVLYTAV